ncbi:MAG: hypothetical protein N2648_04695 [Aquificaceae bacterium]|nr:hypothetical protein [Aquificaceae bacterium]MCX7989923.1 hypothetical protein [Aquificaceae bacterium]
MKRIALLAAIVGSLSLSVPLDLSFAGTKVKKQVVQGKAKKKVKSKVSKAKNTKTTYKRPRYAKNINQPQEGELLKLEGMVKDLNEQ